MKSAKVFKSYWHIKGSDLRLVKILWLAEGNQTHFVDYQLKRPVEYFEKLAHEQVTTSSSQNII